MNQVVKSFLAVLAVLPVLEAGVEAQQCGDWGVVPSPDPGGQPVIRDVLVLASDDAWVVGDWFASRILPFSMHWDGLHWTIVDVPLPNDLGNGSLYAIDASGPDNIWAGGGFEVVAPDGFFGTHVYALRWDGTDWELMDTPIASGSS